VHAGGYIYGGRVNGTAASGDLGTSDAKADAERRGNEKFAGGFAARQSGPLACDRRLCVQDQPDTPAGGADGDRYELQPPPRTAAQPSRSTTHARAAATSFPAPRWNPVRSPAGRDRGADYRGGRVCCAGVRRCAPPSDAPRRCRAADWANHRVWRARHWCASSRRPRHLGLHDQPAGGHVHPPAHGRRHPAGHHLRAGASSLRQGSMRAVPCRPRVIGHLLPSHASNS